MARKIYTYVQVRVHCSKKPAKEKKKERQKGQKRVSKWIEKPLSPNGNNNGSQAHDINKWALRKQMDQKEPEEREVANP